MEKLKYIKIEHQDGTLSENVPIGADASNVDVSASKTLNTKLNELDASDTQHTNAISTLNTSLNNEISNRTSAVSILQSQVSSLASGSPAGIYTTVTDLTSADPDHSKIYVVTADGHWYYYNNGWQDGGTYQSTKIDKNDPIIAEISNDLYYQDWKLIEITKREGYFAYVNGQTSDTGSNGVLSQYTAYYCSNTIPVNGGDKFKISGYSRVNTPLCVFYDENYKENNTARRASYVNYYGTISTATQHIDEEITIPATVKYMIVNNTATIYQWKNLSNIEKVNNDLTNEIHEQTTYDKNIKETSENSLGLFQTSSESIITDYGYSHTSRNCVAGEKLKIIGMTIHGNFKLWNLVDENTGHVIESSASGSGSVQYVEDEITISQNGILYVNGNEIAGHPATIYLIKHFDTPFEYSNTLDEIKNNEILDIRNDISKISLDDFEEQELQRRCYNLENNNIFAWKDFDKAYFAFVIDDCNSFLVPTYDLFHTLEVPLGVAAIVERLNTIYTDYEPDNTRSVEDILKLVEKDNGEILAHYGGNLADPEYAEQHPDKTYITTKEGWESKTKKVKQQLTEKGFTVRGLIRADSTQANSNNGEIYCRKYFDYSDTMGKTSKYDLGTRKFFIGVSTMQAMKNWIDQACLTPGFYPFCFHGKREDEPLATIENLTEIINYIKDKGNNVAVITTYSNVFDTFKTTTIEKRLDALENSLL